MTGYHVSPRDNRLAIRRWGLIPRDTTRDGHFADAAYRNAGVLAVYVHDDPAHAAAWRDSQYWEYDVDGPHELDVWAVDYSGLAHEPDPYRGNAYYLQTATRVLERVGPERLTLLPAADVPAPFYHG